MDGLIILGSSGRPIVLSRFRHKLSAYPLVHVDRLNHALAALGTSADGAEGAGLSELADDAGADGVHTARTERDVPPVIRVPIDGWWDASEDSDDELAGDESASGDEEEDAEESDEAESADHDDGGAPEEQNVWSREPARAPEPPAPGEPDAAETDAASERSPEGAQVPDLPPEGGSVLCHIKVGELRFLCPVSREVDPLVPFSFLRRVVSVIQEYLVGSQDPAQLTEEVVREHFDVVYELIEEMLDGEGNVILTEPNALKDIVLPPSWLDRLVRTAGLGSQTEQKRASLASPVPWRRPAPKYSKNELYMDLVESLEGIVDAHGAPVAVQLWGRMHCTAWLSGTPLVSISLRQPNSLEDACFHPCVRHEPWRKSRRLSFVPPDGAFDLATYRLPAPGTSPFLRSAGGSVPLSLDVHLDAAPLSETGARRVTRFSLTLEPRISAPHQLEDVSIEWFLGNSSLGIDAAARLRDASARSSTSLSSMGSSHADEVGGAQAAGAVLFNRSTHTLRWTVPKLTAAHAAMVNGTITTGDAACSPSYALQVRFSVPGLSLTGVRPDAIQLEREAYVPAKGVRSVLQGDLEWRRS